jgi:glycosyltransferase involved in cell wall biosynthesis
MEDFGIITVEAQACGAPVIAAGAGGNTDTVLSGRTGALYPFTPGPGAARTLAAELARFDTGDYDPAVITAHAAQFSQPNFRTRFRVIAEGFLAL